MRCCGEPPLFALRLASSFLLFLLAVDSAQGGSFQISQAISASTPDAVSHPLGYNGTGGELTVSVCVDPTSSFAQMLPAPLKRALTTLNDLTPTTGTYIAPGQSTEVPPDQWDAESALLHEVAHCIGINHTNLGPLLPEVEAIFFGNASYSSKGADADFSFVSIGPDNIWGSDDDDRGDDINLVWFRKSSNDPFFIDPPPPPATDSSTYSRSLADLPPMHSYAANGTPSVADQLGYPGTRAVMYAQIGPQSEFRALANDDVAMLRYGMSGLDESASTPDDYTFKLELTGYPCDLPVSLVSLGESPVSRCGVNYDLIPGSTDHFQVEPVFVQLNSDFVWFFGLSLDLEITKSDGGMRAVPGEVLSYTISVSNTGELNATGVEIEEVVPNNASFDAGGSTPGWSCTSASAGSQCLFQLGAVTSGGPAIDVTFAVTVDDPLPGEVSEIVNVVTVSDDGTNGPDTDPANDTAQTNTSIARETLFADGFESGDTSTWSATVP